MIRRAADLSDATVNEQRTVTATGALIGTRGSVNGVVLEIRVPADAEIEVK